MARTYLTCPLCGFAFERMDGTAGPLSRCPVCEYEIPETLPSESWFRKSPLPGEGLPTVRDLKTRRPR